MVDAHRQPGNVGIVLAVEFLLLESTHQIDEVGAAAKMAGLGEVAVGENVAGAQVDKPRARGELARHGRNVVLGSGRQTSCAEREAVVLVGYGIEEPLNVFLAGDDARQTENLEGRIVGMHAHIHIALVAYGHDGRKEILHVLAQLVAVDTLVQGEQLAEQLYRMLIALLEVAAHEALRLDDDVLDKLVLLLGRHGLPQFLHLF